MRRSIGKLAERNTHGQQRDTTRYTAEEWIQCYTDHELSHDDMTFAMHEWQEWFVNSGQITTATYTVIQQG